MLKQDNLIQAELVLMGWRFGQSYGGGHLAGQMVMEVLAERVRAGWGSWLQVIEGVPNFMAEYALPELKYPSIWEPGFVKLLHTVEGIHSGSSVSLTKGALYFADLNHIQRSWFKERIVDAINPDTGLRQHSIVANMNSLSFWS